MPFQTFDQQYGEAKTEISNVLNMGVHEFSKQIQPQHDLNQRETRAFNAMCDNIHLFNQHHINAPMHRLLDRQQDIVSSLKVKATPASRNRNKGELGRATLELTQKGFNTDINSSLNPNLNARMNTAIDHFVDANIDHFLELTQSNDRRRAEDDLKALVGHYVAQMEQQMLQIQHRINQEQIAKVEELRNLELLRFDQAKITAKYLGDNKKTLNLSDRPKQIEPGKTYKTSPMAPAMAVVKEGDEISISFRTIYSDQSDKTIEMLMNAQPGTNNVTIILGQSDHKFMTEQDAYRLTAAKEGSYLNRTAFNMTIYAKYGVKLPKPKEFLHLVGPGNLFEDADARDTHIQVDSMGIPTATAESSADKFFAKDANGDFLRDENGHRIMKHDANIEDKTLFNAIEQKKLAMHPHIDANRQLMKDPTTGQLHRRHINVNVASFVPSVDQANAIDTVGDLIDTYREMVDAKNRYELKHAIDSGAARETEEQVFKDLHEREPEQDENASNAQQRPGMRVRR